jgi:alpha-galactosidase
VHQQTLGMYQLLDDLRAYHPNVEFETCASGGGRIDLAMLRRTSRAWTSDCNDPLDRQRIQRGFTHLFPPEYMGAHIGGPVSHTTRRRHSLAFRAGTAFFGHLGIEWNVLTATAEECTALSNVIAQHKRFRPLLHGGRSVRFDHPNPAVVSHGVISADQSEALLSYALVATPESLVVEPLLVYGLHDDRRYRVEIIDLVAPAVGAARRQPRWTTEPVTVPGRVLRTVGLQPPTIDAESMILVHLRAE